MHHPRPRRKEAFQENVDLRLIDALMEERRSMDSLIRRLQDAETGSDKRAIIREFDAMMEASGIEARTKAIWRTWKKEAKESLLPNTTTGRSTLLVGSGSWEEHQRGRVENGMYCHEVLVSCGSGASERALRFRIGWDSQDLLILYSYDWPGVKIAPIDREEKYWIGFALLDNEGRASSPKWFALNNTSSIDKQSLQTNFEFMGMNPTKSKMLVCLAGQDWKGDNV